MHTKSTVQKKKKEAKIVQKLWDFDEKVYFLCCFCEKTAIFYKVLVFRFYDHVHQCKEPWQMDGQIYDCFLYSVGCLHNRHQRKTEAKHLLKYIICIRNQSLCISHPFFLQSRFHFISSLLCFTFYYKIAVVICCLPSIFSLFSNIQTNLLEVQQNLPALSHLIYIFIHDSIVRKETKKPKTDQS